MHPNLRRRRNAYIVQWLQALIDRGGSALLSATDVDRAKLYHLGAMFAEQRGLLRCRGTVDVISYEYRRYAYTLTPKGERAVRMLGLRVSATACPCERERCKYPLCHANRE